MKSVLAILLFCLLPACADRSGDEITPVPAAMPEIQVPAQLLNVQHDGHLYVVALFQNGGAILHSPNCPAERFGR